MSSQEKKYLIRLRTLSCQFVDDFTKPGNTYPQLINALSTARVQELFLNQQFNIHITDLAWVLLLASKSNLEVFDTYSFEEMLNWQEESVDHFEPIIKPSEELQLKKLLIRLERLKKIHPDAVLIICCVLTKVIST